MEILNNRLLKLHFPNFMFTGDITFLLYYQNLAKMEFETPSLKQYCLMKHVWINAIIASLKHILLLLVEKQDIILLQFIIFSQLLILLDFFFFLGRTV